MVRPAGDFYYDRADDAAILLENARTEDAPLRRRIEIPLSGADASCALGTSGYYNTKHI